MIYYVINHITIAIYVTIYMIVSVSTYTSVIMIPEMIYTRLYVAVAAAWISKKDRLYSITCL